MLCAGLRDVTALLRSHSPLPLGRRAALRHERARWPRDHSRGELWRHARRRRIRKAPYGRRRSSPRVHKADLARPACARDGSAKDSDGRGDAGPHMTTTKAPR